MSDSLLPIRVSERISTARKKVADAAAEVNQIQTQLWFEYHQNIKKQMGQSDDLAVFEDKFNSGLDRLKELSAMLNDFSKKLNAIENNYRNVQEEAIFRATMLPR